jgi:hypothetical protein
VQKGVRVFFFGYNKKFSLFFYFTFFDCCERRGKMSSIFLVLFVARI